MHDNISQDLSNKVLSGLTLQKAIINFLIDHPVLLKNSDSCNQKSFVDREYAEEVLRTLNDEIRKVERLEVTLAVVGTMKAGKSTTINAIVGSEVMPNRNTAMTTLPTVIRHKPGKKTPTLTFSGTKPFNMAVSDLKKHLEKIAPEKIEELPFYATQDGKKIVLGIMDETLIFQDAYNGSEEIFRFLKLINDVSRLCDQVGIDSPLREYTGIDEFPVIEIEFFHLRGQQENTGRFSLIDAPGPNEAGKNYLRKILNDQIEKASAILAVMDYEQLNTEADAEIREKLQPIVSRNRERIFVYANKFDKRNSNSMKQDELKRYIAKDLFNGDLEGKQIFPVSSKYAYLANRVERELEIKGVLPDFQKNGWVADFGKEAMGKRWKRDIDDMKEVKDCCDALWEDSFYEEPLEIVVRKTANRAMPLSIKSAKDKIQRYDEEILNSLASFPKIINHYQICQREMM